MSSWLIVEQLRVCLTSFCSILTILYRVFVRQVYLAVVFYAFCIGLSELAAARGGFACIQYKSVYEKVYLYVCDVCMWAHVSLSLGSVCRCWLLAIIYKANGGTNNNNTLAKVNWKQVSVKKHWNLFCRAFLSLTVFLFFFLFFSLSLCVRFFLSFYFIIIFAIRVIFILANAF